MNPRRLATLATAFYPAAIVAGWAFVSLTCAASPRVDSTAVAHAVDRLAPPLTASIESAARQQADTQHPQTQQATATNQAIAPSQAVATNYVAPDTPEVAAAAQLVAQFASDTKPVAEAKPVAAEAKPIAEPIAPEPEPKKFVVASLGDPTHILPSETPPVQAAAAGTADPLPQAALPQAPQDASPQDAQPQDIRPTPRLELVGECLIAERCIDQYLYALYERTPKEDTIKEIEKRKVEVKRKGKMVTVTRSFTKLVENDFTWKDPHAAERAGMSMSDYVIGGMDRKFKLKLFYMLQAAENAGLQPGITSAFRDDYRQSIASGLKAAANRSYHGGSLRGGYGRGLAADIVSVNGANRAQRWASTEAFWKWVDANGPQYGIGRPYLRFDPPHVGPMDGPEYASRRGGTRTASADVKKRQKQVAQARSGAAKPKPQAAAKPQLAARKPASKPAGRLAAAR